MQPRQELLDIWRAVAQASWHQPESAKEAGRWTWGGKLGTNSIGDAEQLLCLLLPAVQVEVFGLDQPDRTGEQMLEVLQSFGGSTEIPRRLLSILIEYYERYTVDGAPIFSGGSYFDSSDPSIEPTEEQLSLDIVDSFAMAITLSLATIGFVRVFSKTTKRSDVQKMSVKLEEMASSRLSAAMIGLLRSFTVNVFDSGSRPGKNLIRTINQSGRPARQVVADLQKDLRQTAASFREVLIGSGQVSDLDDPDRLFECGWSWGIVAGAPKIAITPTVDGQRDGATKPTIGSQGDGAAEPALYLNQRDGVAEAAPYLYFTVIAMDAIEDLFSERSRILGLLDEEQQRLSRALQLRSDLTRTYWAKVATFSAGPRWPIEDIPWRTTDGIESEYYTLQVTSLAVKGLTTERGSDAELMRIGEVLNELANRARITRRPLANDPAMVLHSPGVELQLIGSESRGDARLTWRVLEFAPLLLQRLVYIAGLVGDAKQRSTLLDMADRVWEHLIQRRLQDSIGQSLWDQPAGAFPDLQVAKSEAPSWYYTERVVLALVTTAKVLSRPPLHSDRMSAVASELLNEADQLFDNELMRGSSTDGPVLESRIKEIQAALRRARDLLSSRPGTAAALCSGVLLLLDELAASRKNASEVM